MTVTSAPTLESRLRAVIEAKSLLAHPFYQAWTAGTLPKERLQEYARQYYQFEVRFPRFLSAIHARTESAEVRQTLLANLWDEEHGERNHPALWLEFAEALGVPAAEVLSAKPNAETAALIDHFSRMSNEAPVAEALATLFAYEGQVPAVATQKVLGLRDFYGLTADQYEFFSIHRDVDAAHSAGEIAAIERTATDDAACEAAASATCDRLLAFLDGCYSC